VVNQGWQQPVDPDGRARFPHVPLGETFTAGTHFWAAEVTGPTSPGQTVDRTLELIDLVYALSGRLFGPDSEPLAGSVATATFDFGTSTGGTWVETDANGRFLWIVPHVRAGMPAPKIARLAFEKAFADGPPVRCEVAPRELHRGRNELGDLRLGLDALVVGGRFVFDCSRAMPVTYAVERLEPGTRPGQGESWRTVEGLQHVQGRAPRFETRGTVGPGRYRLAFQRHAHLPIEPVEFAPGTADLEVAVACGTALVATCFLPAGVEPHQLRLELVPPHAAAASTADRQRSGSATDLLRAHVVGRDEEGRTHYHWAAVADGKYTLRVIGPQVDPLLEIEDVAVPLPDGGDPRLADIDLRRSLAAIELKVRFAGETERRRPAFVFLLPQPDHGDWHGMAIWGSGVLPVSKGAVDLLVASPGCRPVTLRGVERNAEAALEPWPSVDLFFAGIEELPADASLSAGRVRPASEPRDRRQYHTDNRDGPLDSLLGVGADFPRIENGRATLRLGDGPQPLHVVMRIGRLSQQLQQVVPAEVVAGPPMTIQLSADEIRQVADEQRQQQKK
jgi:hypothetical protein